MHNEAWDEEGINTLPDEAKTLCLMRPGMKNS